MPRSAFAHNPRRQGPSGHGRPGPLRGPVVRAAYRGHLHPFVPLARAFVRAGHRGCPFATGDDVGKVIAGAGLTWLPAGLNPHELWQRIPRRGPRLWRSRSRSKSRRSARYFCRPFRPDVMIRVPTDLAPVIVSADRRCRQRHLRVVELHPDVVVADPRGRPDHRGAATR